MLVFIFLFFYILVFLYFYFSVFLFFCIFVFYSIVDKSIVEQTHMC